MGKGKENEKKKIYIYIYISILSCMFGNKEMKKEKRIIHFSFLPFAKIKKIKRRINVFNFCANMNVKEMTIMGKNEILGYKKLNM